MDVVPTTRAHTAHAAVATPSRSPLSAELFVVPLETVGPRSAPRYLVYAPLRRVAFVANARAVNALSALREGRQDLAADADGAMLQFLRHLEIADGGPERPPVTSFEGEPLPTTLTLFLTTACNLRCTYCYASAGDTPLRSMTLETARRGVDFVTANAVRKGQRNVEVCYHGGGEPTANWSVMTESLAYARRRAADLGLDVFAASASNGVLRDGQIDWILANLQSVSLSYDGLPEAHDRHRLTVAGTGSSGRVMHTMRRFDAADFNYGVRVTVTRDQIPNLPASVEFIFEQFRPRRVQVEPAYQLGRWSEAPSAETEEFIAAYREAQARAAKFGRDICYSAARLDTLSNHFCGITQDSFALSPDGNVSACYEVFSESSPMADVFFYGRPQDAGADDAGPANDAPAAGDGGGQRPGAGRGYVFNLKVLNELRRQSVEHREFCRGCFAKWHCAGDCYHKALSVNGREGEFAGSDRCHITRELLKDQVLARVAASGGMFWHEPGSDEDCVGAEGAARPGGKEFLL